MSDQCQQHCAKVGGLFDDDTCYQFGALKKICIKIDMNYYDNLLPEDAEIVSGVGLVAGCYIDGEAGKYEPVSLQPNTKAGTVIDFTDVAVEVRDTHDPYTVFSGVNNEGGTDLSIFFWVSMLCLAVSVVLIFYLTAYYYCYIAIGKPRSKMTEDERAMEEAENG